MCPSFRATGEEQHSTRGRARLLHEMLAGEVITDGWRSRGGARRPRPVPVLQGLPQRLPGRRRHGHLQGGVPAPPLRGPAAPRRALRDGPAPAVAARGGPGRARCSTPSPAPRSAAARQTARRASRRSGRSRSWRPSRSPGGGGAGTEASGPYGRDRRRTSPNGTVVPLARHLHQPPLPGGRPGRRAGPGGRRAAAPLPPTCPDPAGRCPGRCTAPVLRADLCLHRPARPGARGHAPHRRRPGAAAAGRPPAGRPGTELRRRPAHGPAGTAGRRPAGRPTRRVRADLRAGPGGAGPRLAATAPRPPGRRPDALPPARRPRRRGGPPPARTRGSDRTVERRLLRPGRQLRLRAGHYDVSVACAEDQLLPVRTGVHPPTPRSSRTASPAAPSSTSSATVPGSHLAEVLAEALGEEPAGGE